MFSSMNVELLVVPAGVRVLNHFFHQIVHTLLLGNVVCLTDCPYISLYVFFSLPFSQDSKRSAEIVASPSLDVFLPEDEDNPYESVTTAVTRKPCSLDINHQLNAFPRNGRPTLLFFFLKSVCHLQF